jgi:hypothetical protein
MRRAALTAYFCLTLATLLIYISNSIGFSAEEAKPNELGKVLILEYHLIQPGTGEWVRTAQDFRNDLELLYRTGYRSVTLSDYVQGKLDIPAGTHPVIFTFDDSSPGQFRYLVQNGKKEIDPDCAVGMLMDFKKRHPDFGLHATFFVLPAAKEPHKLFGQPEFESEKLKELVAMGFEIGNHTLWHANLKKYDATVVRKQLALAVQAIQAAVPGYNVHTLALPFGVFPKDPGLAVSGSFNQISYHNDAILKVSGGPAPSPFSTRCDFLHLPRIQVTGKDLQIIISSFEKRPAELFTSDGKADTVTFPASLKSEFQPPRFKTLRSVSY